MSTNKYRLLMASALTLNACSMAPVQQTETIRDQSVIAVVPLQDCPAATQPACMGSGSLIASMLERALGRNPRVAALWMARPTEADRVLSDKTAGASARAKQCGYIVTGGVTDYASGLAPMLFRSALTLRLIRAKDGIAVAQYSDQRIGTTLFQTPESLHESMVKHFAAALD